MLGKIAGGMMILSVAAAFFTGRISEVGLAAVEGAGTAVKLVISLAGLMCLWNGLMGVARSAGLIEKLSSAIMPLLGVLFPGAYHLKREGNADAAAALNSISLNVAANMLGIGNAATPVGIDAMKRLNRLNPRAAEGVASHDMVMLACFNCASVQIVPTTLITLRSAAESAAPFAVIPAVWICSALTAAASVLFVKALC